MEKTTQTDNILEKLLDEIVSIRKTIERNSIPHDAKMQELRASAVIANGATGTIITTNIPINKEAYLIKYGFGTTGGVGALNINMVLNASRLIPIENQNPIAGYETDAYNSLTPVSIQLEKGILQVICTNNSGAQQTVWAHIIYWYKGEKT